MTTLTTEKAKKINANGEKYGKKFWEANVSTSQLRKIYGEIKRAENEFKFDKSPEQAKQTLQLLKPHLAYAASRHEEMEIVHEKVSSYISWAVEDEDRMELFFHLMEAIVAYHAYYDNKEGDN